MSLPDNRMFADNIAEFIDEKINDLTSEIDIDYASLLPKKSEDFVQQVLKDTKGDLVVNEPVHNIMHRFIRKSRKMGFNKFGVIGAFGHGKSEQLCIGYVLDAIARNPNILVKVVHVADDQAVARCRAIRDYITNDEDFRRMAPHIKSTNIWGSQRFIVKRKSMSKDGTVEAYGVLSTSLGGRANLIVFDDPQDLKTAVFEPTTRTKIEETVKNVWLTRLIPQESEVLLMMNKWSQFDLAAYVQKNPTWSWMTVAVSEKLDHLVYEDSFGKKYKLPLWTKFNHNDLIDKKISLGERDFNRGYRLIPFSDDDKTFMFFENCCHYGISPHSFIENQKDWDFISGIDFAGSKRPGTIIVTVAKHKQTNVKIPVDIVKMKGSTDLIKNMVRLYREYGVDYFIAENNGVQSAIIDMMVSALGDEKFKKYGITIEGFCTGNNKADPNMGLPSLDREFEKREWMFCFNQKPEITDNNDEKVWSRYYYEMKEHPIYETSDIVMATWFCREGFKNMIRRSGIIPIY